MITENIKLQQEHDEMVYREFVAEETKDLHTNNFLEELLVTFAIGSAHANKNIKLTLRTTELEREIYDELDSVSYLKRADLVVAGIRRYYDFVTAKGKKNGQNILLKNESMVHLSHLIDNRKKAGIKDTTISIRISEADEVKLNAIASELNTSKSNAAIALIMYMHEELCMRRAEDYIKENN